MDPFAPAPISIAPCGPSAPDPLPLPRSLRLHDYELLERVGQGGMAEVWMARRAVIPGCLKTCALKIIHGRVATDPRYRRMFLQEARLALKLRHANVVSVFDVGEAEGRLYMALEWVDGVHLRDFAQLVREHLGPLPVPVVCHLVCEILQGLRHAHELRVGGRSLHVVHRDVAPHNVLVSAAGEVKLGDFGIARVHGELSSGEHIKGRARYMAPEQLHGDPTQASDLYAVGAILHELLDGRRFREELDERTDWHVVVSEATLPPLQRRDVPPALETLRVGLLQPDPERRIASADEALGWLLRCPPWPSGATTLRELYARCVGTARRTGLTNPDAIRLPPARPQWCRLLPAPDVRAVAPTPQHARPPVLPHLVPAAPPSPVPVPSLPAPSRPELTATLRHRVQTPSWTPTPSLGTEPVRATLDEAGLVRHGSALRPPRRPTSPGAALRWLGGSLWLLTGLLAVIAASLALAPTPVRAPAPARSSACIDEPPVPPARRAWLRLRGDGLPRGQVRIDMHVLDVASRAECWVSPGVHALAWRGSPEEAWQPVGMHTLVSAKEHLFRLGDDGLAISAYDP